MIKQDILRQSFHEISHDTKFIRLATITTFIHSVLFLLYLAYAFSSVFTGSQGFDNEVVSFVMDALNLEQGMSIGLILLIGIPLLIGYSILPPIGEGAMIFYLHNPKKQGTVSLGKGMTRFLQMFEFDAAISFFNLAIFLVVVSRMYITGILDSPIIIILLSIWAVVIILAAFLLPYTRYFIVLQKMKFFEAMKASMEMSIEHFGLTIKFILVDIILHVRFIINIIIVLGIPLGLIYLTNWLGLGENGIMKTIFVILVIALFLVTAYINGIIEAFFMTYRYKLYRHVLAEEKGIQDAIDSADLPTDLANHDQTRNIQTPQHVVINQYVVGPQGQTQTPQQPHHQYVVPEDTYTIPSTSQGQAPHPIPVSQNIQDIPGAQKIPAPDGGHFVYVPPQPEQPTPPEQETQQIPDIWTYTQQVLDGEDETDTPDQQDTTS